MSENFSESLHKLKTAGRIMYGLGSFGDHNARMRILADLMTIESNRQDDPYTEKTLLDELELFRLSCINTQTTNNSSINDILRASVDCAREDSLKAQIQTLRERMAELENQMDELSDQAEALDDELFHETHHLNEVRHEVERTNSQIRVMKSTNQELKAVNTYAGELSRLIEASMKQKM